MGGKLATLVLAVAAGSLCACATVTRGRSTAWVVNTMPTGATVETSTGVGCNATPCSIMMARRSQFVASITKPGYKPMTLNVSHHVSVAGGAAFLGNALIGGALGATVDVVTGATEDLAPNNMTMVLEREAVAPWAAAVQSYSTNRMWSQDNPPPPIQQPSSYVADQTAAPVPSGGGRTVELRVLPDGVVQDVRESQ